MTKRTITLEFSSCKDCPMFRDVQMYANHYIECALFGYISETIYSYRYEDIEEQLKDWFCNKCVLEEIGS